MDALWEYDEAVRNSVGIFCGVDEAGRGPLAGDVYAAAVILNPDNYIEGLNDSKKLSEKKREKLYDEIIHISAQSTRVYYRLHTSAFADGNFAECRMCCCCVLPRT